jgi:O-acetyl-ADP-ribose deacetylase (regulator of RNase III)
MPEMPGWSNPSVIAFASGGDPLERASMAARQLLQAAAARGMSVPPVDPLALARLLGLGTAPRDDVADASIAEDRRGVDARGGGDAPLRGFVQTDTPLLIAYNPNRPKGRLRFSIAHEVAHALFPGVAEVVRHRTPVGALPDVWDSDEYELELLCNIVAGELLLPAGAVAGLLDIDTDIDFIMETRRRWDVSTEALLWRLAMSSRRALTLVAASRVTARDPAHLKIDYVVGPVRAGAGGGQTSASHPPLRRGQRLDPATPFAACTAVGQPGRGTMTMGDRDWSAQVVGIPGYPGQLFPRVLGLVELVGGPANPRIRHVQSDLLEFGDDSGPVIVAHVVNDSARAWSRRGVAATLAARWPQAGQAFRAWAIASSENLQLGTIHACEQRDGDRVVTIVSMVAQQGFGPGAVTRLRYDALHETLVAVADLAQRTGATVHVPRIGAGQAGGRWDLIESDLAEVIADKGIGLIVHTLPLRARMPGPHT